MFGQPIRTHVSLQTRHTHIAATRQPGIQQGQRSLEKIVLGYFQTPGATLQALQQIE